MYILQHSEACTTG